jgi:hypothetical protein
MEFFSEANRTRVFPKYLAAVHSRAAVASTKRTEGANTVTPLLGHAPKLVKILRKLHLSRSEESWKRDKLGQRCSHDA